MIGPRDTRSFLYGLMCYVFQVIPHTFVWDGPPCLSITQPFILRHHREYKICCLFIVVVCLFVYCCLLLFVY